MVKTLIYLDSQYAKKSIQLLEVVNQLYRKDAGEVCAVVFGELLEEARGFFDKIYQFKVTGYQEYNARWKAACIKQLYDTELFSCIIVPATQEGRLLAPILAMKLHTGLVADVTAVTKEDGQIRMIRPAFDGKLMAVIANQNSTLVMMSVRLGVFAYHAEGRKNAQVVVFETETEIESNIQLISIQEIEESTDIRDMQVLVSGGGGATECFAALHRLAEPLKGMVSASRRLVDNGIAPRSIQVGQSGKIVSPKLYIAIGIYGALQHIEGLDNVKYIISVNKNQHAPICSLSTIVVEGDAMQFIKQLSNKIKQKKMEELT